MSEITHALDRLSQSGYKLTGKRQELLEILSDESRYLPAKDIYKFMAQTYPSISLDTIYRNLNTFTELGIVEETEWDNERSFRFKCDVNHHHHHFICERCGRTKELNCPMELFQVQIPDYEIRDHRFEVFGLCDKCKIT